jgi:hypothetical protein
MSITNGRQGLCMELLLSKCEQGLGMSFPSTFLAEGALDDFNFDCFLTKKE